MAIGAAVDEVVDDGIKIIVFTVNFIRNLRQILGLHQLKLMPNRRNDAFVSLPRVVNERAIAALHFLFNHAAPADAMIRQLAVPFIVIERDLAFFQALLWRFAFTPGFAAIEFIKLA